MKEKVGMEGDAYQEAINAVAKGASTLCQAVGVEDAMGEGQAALKAHCLGVALQIWQTATQPPQQEGADVTVMPIPLGLLRKKFQELAAASAAAPDPPSPECDE